MRHGADTGTSTRLGKQIRWLLGQESWWSSVQGNKGRCACLGRAVASWRDEHTRCARIAESVSGVVADDCIPGETTSARSRP